MKYYIDGIHRNILESLWITHWIDKCYVIMSYTFKNCNHIFYWNIWNKIFWTAATFCTVFPIPHIPSFPYSVIIWKLNGNNVIIHLLSLQKSNF